MGNLANSHSVVALKVELLGVFLTRLMLPKYSPYLRIVVSSSIVSTCIVPSSKVVTYSIGVMTATSPDKIIKKSCEYVPFSYNVYPW